MQEDEMPTPQQLEAEFWTSLKSDMTMMLGLDGVEDGHTRPMTCQIEGDRGPIWFFTSTENGIVRQLTPASRAIASFTSKGHDLFASLQGKLSADKNPANVDRLWNRYVAAWYPGGKEDPKLVLLRLDPETAEIWQNDYSLVAGIKMLLGSDPKEDYKDKAAKVTLKTGGPDPAL
jgi:general stress protein 26